MKNESPERRAKRLEAKARYRAKYREKLAAKQRAYHEATKPARKVALKAYYERNKGIILPKMRAYADANRGHKRAVDRAYAAANKERAAERIREWRENGPGRAWMRAYLEEYRARPAIRAAHAMAGRIRAALKANGKSQSTAEIVGYTIADLRAHLERQFTPGMSWENYGKVWHVDHILSAPHFDLPDELAAYWALSNLRPLAKSENLAKGAKRLHLL